VDIVRIKQTLAFYWTFHVLRQPDKSRCNNYLRGQILLTYGTLIANRWCIVDVKFCWIKMLLVQVTQGFTHVTPYW